MAARASRRACALAVSRSAPASCARRRRRCARAWRAAGLARRRALPTRGGWRWRRGERRERTPAALSRSTATPRPAMTRDAARRRGQARARAAPRRRRCRRALRRRRSQLRRRGWSRCRATARAVRVIAALPERDGESPLALTLAVAALKARPARLGDREGHRAGRRPHPAVHQRAHAGRPSRDRQRRWRQIALAAAKQCGRSVAPAIGAPLDFAAVLALPAAARLLFAEDGSGAAGRIDARRRPPRCSPSSAPRAASPPPSSTPRARRRLPPRQPRPAHPARRNRRRRRGRALPIALGGSRRVTRARRSALSVPCPHSR